MSSFNQDELKNYLGEQRNELPFASSVCRFGMYCEWIATLTHTHSCISRWSERGVYVFCFRKKCCFFAYSTMLFIEWNLRDFSPCWLQLASTLPASLFAKQGLRRFYICWDFRFIFCLSHHCCQQSWTLPQSSLGCFLFFFFLYLFTIHFSYCHANLDICPRGVDSRLIFSFPL